MMKSLDEQLAEALARAQRAYRAAMAPPRRRKPKPAPAGEENGSPPRYPLPLRVNN
jgi:hypothetical protein